MTVTELQNENLSLQIQLENARAEASRPKWLFRTALVSSIGVPIVTVLIQVVMHLYELDGQVKNAETVVAKVEAVGEKADVAATKAILLEKKADEISKDTASVNAINTEWKASKTGDPDDMAKAERAEAKVIAQQEAKPQ